MGRWFRDLNLKVWHKLSAAFVLIAIIGIVVFFQFAPENARSKTFPPKADLRPRRMRLGCKPRADTFLQTAWSSVAAAATHAPDAQNKTTAAYAGFIFLLDYDIINIKC